MAPEYEYYYRNKIGLGVALEALREEWRARRFTLNVPAASDRDRRARDRETVLDLCTLTALHRTQSMFRANANTKQPTFGRK